jgi:3',5'-nucleoside bisphosphate phosphatase
MIDLHCHSVFSDGTDEPETLALMAQELGLHALALTDHDTLGGLPRFLAMQPRVTVRLVPGIELSCQFLGSELHLLGLFVDPGNPRFRERVDDLHLRRQARNAGMLARLQELGVPIRWADVVALAPSDLVSRVHFAQALVRSGAVSHAQEAFKRYLGEGCPAFEPFQELSPGEACRWIREAGGVVVVAHPARTRRGFPWEDALVRLRGEGVAGLECHYSDYSPTEERYFCELAARLGLARSGGSDYHGGTKPGIRLGAGRGNLSVPDAFLAELEALRNGPGT